mmetsp:Transcript_4920/g.8552  ORF Transcript_4920/g.8552 Transcript_4920/m.8552 type:complete len:180 (-) Transcript_4920:267-806(-)
MDNSSSSCSSLSLLDAELTARTYCALSGLDTMLALVQEQPNIPCVSKSNGIFSAQKLSKKLDQYSDHIDLQIKSILLYFALSYSDLQAYIKLTYSNDHGMIVSCSPLDSILKHLKKSILKLNSHKNQLPYAFMNKVSIVESLTSELQHALLNKPVESFENRLTLLQLQCEQILQENRTL